MESVFAFVSNFCKLLKCCKKETNTVQKERLQLFLQCNAIFVKKKHLKQPFSVTITCIIDRDFFYDFSFKEIS